MDAGQDRKAKDGLKLPSCNICRKQAYDGTFEQSIRREGMCAIRASLDRQGAEWWVEGRAGVVKWGTKVGPGSGSPWQQGIQGEVWGGQGA